MCDTLVVVEPGRVLFAKNSDRDANEAQVLTWAPAARHPEGAELQCTWIRVPQVARTHAVLLSRPFWTWGAEMGANEHGVVIGNEAVFTDQPCEPTGLTGMDLLRLGLERGASAREAAEVIVALLERHGQGGGCGLENKNFTYHNSWLIADPTGAFRLESAGRRWALAPVQGVCSISNGLTDPDFARANAEPLGVKTWFAAARRRQARTAALAAEARSLADLRAILRDHGGTARGAWRWWNGTLGAVCMHGGGLIASSQTTASWVAELGPEGARHQVTGTSAPCLGVFKPVSVHEPLELGPEPGERADAGSLWWRWERHHRLALADLDQAGARLIAERDALEARFDRDPPPSAIAFAEADRLLEAALAGLRGAPLAETRPPAARAFWRRRDRMAGLA